MKVLCIGHASYDITMPVLEFPKENSKNRVKQMIKCGGGPASNAAYLLAKWGMEVYFAGILGNDIYGKNILKEFHDINVNTKYTQIIPGYETPSSFILANTKSGSRTIVIYKDSKYKMADCDLHFKPDYILVDGTDYEFAKKVILNNPDSISVIDAGTAKFETINLAKLCDYVVCSKVFAEKVVGEKIDINNNDSIISFMSSLKSFFKGQVVVTLEDKGSLYFKDNKIMLMPTLEVEAIDTTGAGDIFHGAFLYALANNYNYDDVIKIANYAGAISATRLGGRNSMPEKEEMVRYINGFR